MRILTITYLLIVSLGASAQNLETDFKKINQNYSLDSFSAHYLYQYSVNGTVRTNENIQIQRKGDHYYAKTNNITQVGDAEKIITVYAQEKLMVVANGLSADKNPHEFDFDEILSLVDSSSLERDTVDERIYRLYYKENHEFDELVISFNPITYSINFMELVESNGTNVARLRIKYLSFSSQINKGLFKSTDYASVSKGAISVTDKYKTFRVIDNRLNLKP